MRIASSQFDHPTVHIVVQKKHSDWQFPPLATILLIITH